MPQTDSTFIYVASNTDEATARADYQVVKDLHAEGLVGSYALPKACRAPR